MWQPGTRHKNLAAINLGNTRKSSYRVYVAEQSSCILVPLVLWWRDVCKVKFCFLVNKVGNKLLSFSRAFRNGAVCMKALEFLWPSFTRQRKKHTGLVFGEVPS